MLSWHRRIDAVATIEMIAYQQRYYEWIQQQGVGLKDRIASSPKSYLSYLNGIVELLGEDISPAMLSTEEDVLAIARKLEGLRAPATIRNYKSAMKQYVAMVVADGLGRLGSVERGTEESGVETVSVIRAEAQERRDNATAHNLYSSYREALLEHIFSGEVMKHLWLRGNVRIETLKPQVDDAGYDLILEANGVVRHVQLKSSHIGASTSEVKVSLDLAKKPSGCVVWLWFDKTTLQLGPFLFFGNAPGQPLPSLAELKIAKHTKANAQGFKKERPNVRVIPKNLFEPLASIEDLVLRLFGPLKLLEPLAE